MQSFRACASRAPHHSSARPCLVPSRSARPARVVRNAAPDDKVFYGREEEFTIMQNMLQDSPTILLMMGPADCGMTALLGRLASAHSGRNLVLDLRQRDTTSPAEFAAVLEEQLKGLGWPINFGEFKISFPGFAGLGPFEFSVKNTAAPSAPSAPGPLGRMQKVLEEWITAAAKEGPAKPLIIIDEANRLADWKTGDNAALQGLLDLLVRVSKQENKCHVILGTSEDLMYYWLEQRGLRQSQFTTMTLGNLSEEAAKSFVGDVLLPGISSKPGRTGFNLEPSMWPQLYAVCGGNFGALRTTAKKAAALYGAGRSLEDAWTTAFRKQLGKAKCFVDLGFDPENLPPRAGEKPAWTRKQWWAALEELTQAPHHVVPEARMVAVLADGNEAAGRAALRSLVRFNLLSLRRESEIAFDLPPEVYGDDGLATVVTVPYQANLAYILSGKWKEGRKKEGRQLDR